MGKYLRKCGGGIREIAVMEVTQVVGAQTRARTLALAAAASAAKVERGKGPKRTKAAAVAPSVPPASEFQISYLQLRNRSVVLRPQRNMMRSASSSTLRRRTSPELGRISRCSSNASCETANSSFSGKPEIVDELELSTCYDSNNKRRETTPSRSTNRGDEASDLESTAEREARWRVTATASAAVPPWEAEVEEFLAAAEKEERLRFAKNYNYDVEEDVPLNGGRYEWVRLSP